MSAWINEFHYDNSGADVGEFVEIAAPAGTNLAGWSIVLYNGSDGRAYGTIQLSGTVANQQNGFGTISVAAVGLQNGSPDGIALVSPDGKVVEFISYEGTMTAAAGSTNGPAAGMTSTPIGPSELGDKSGTSIGRVGTGTNAADFSWALINDDTPGGINVGQSFSNVVVDKPGAFSVSDATATEGNSGTTPPHLHHQPRQRFERGRLGQLHDHSSGRCDRRRRCRLRLTGAERDHCLRRERVFEDDHPQRRRRPRQ
jgi:hypothetical protein